MVRHQTDETYKNHKLIVDNFAKQNSEAYQHTIVKGEAEENMSRQRNTEKTRELAKIEENQFRKAQGEALHVRNPMIVTVF